MSAASSATKTTDGQKDPHSTGGIWIAILVLLGVLGGATAVFGLPGLVAVMVVAALASIAVLVKIITEGI